jgi:2'-5' RNA ligase
MRLFLGIDLPEDAKESLYEQMLPLIKKYPQFNWIRPDTYHATLQFYGEVDDIPHLTSVIESVLFDKEIFYLYAHSIDLFPTQELVLHMTYLREKKIDIIVDELEAVYPSFIKQRSFVFHTTVARAKRSSKQQYLHLRKQLDAMDVNIEFEVKKLTLFASAKNWEGRKYEVVKEFPLSARMK